MSSANDAGDRQDWRPPVTSTAPYMDEPRFVRDVDDAYRRMWRTWCTGASL